MSWLSRFKGMGGVKNEDRPIERIVSDIKANKEKITKVFFDRILFSKNNNQDLQFFTVQVGNKCKFIKGYRVKNHCDTNVYSSVNNYSDVKILAIRFAFFTGSKSKVLELLRQGILEVRVINKTEIITPLFCIPHTLGNEPHNVDAQGFRWFVFDRPINIKKYTNFTVQLMFTYSIDVVEPFEIMCEIKTEIDKVYL